MSNDFKKIRLLHIVKNLGVGGAEIMLLYYIKGLGNKRYKHYVYLFGADGPIKKKIEALGVKVYRGKNRESIKYPIRFIKSTLGLLKDIYFFIKHKNIQLILSHLGQANQLAVSVAKLSKIPVLPVVHNTMAFVDRRKKWDLRKYLIKLVNEFVYRFSDKIIAISIEVKEIIKKKYFLNDTKILVVKNGIFMDKDILAKNIGEEFSESQNKFKIIAVGRLSYQKAFEVLIKAVHEIVNQGHKNIFTLIVGEGEERTYLTQLINNYQLNKYIMLIGIRHDVLELLKGADLFVMPSRYEGLSIAMIEAMACSLPIIASDAPGIRDYIDEEKNGLLFEIENHNALAQKIIKILNNSKLRAKLSNNSRILFEREFSFNENIKPLDKFIQKTLSN